MSRGFAVRLDQPRDPWSPGTLVMRFAINLAGLALANAIVPGIQIGDWQALLAGTALFAIVNILLRPLAMFVSCCLIMATFGLFVLVVNAVLLIVTAWLAGAMGLAFTVDGFWAALFGTLVISAVSLIASIFVGRAR